VEPCTKFPRRHAEYYENLFEQAEDALHLLPPGEVRGTLGRHVDQVRGALAWAFGSGQAPEIGIALTIAAGADVDRHVSVSGMPRVRRAGALRDRRDAEGDPRLEMRLFAILGVMMQHTDGVGPGLEYPWGKVLALAERLGDLDYQLRGLRGLTNGAMTRNYHEAIEVRAALPCCGGSVERSQRPTHRRPDDRVPAASRWRT